MNTRSWRGNRSGSNWRGGGSNNGKENRKGQKICQFFLNNKCRYGKGCKFLHEREPLARRDPQPTPEPTKADARLDEEYMSWRGYLRYPPFSEDTAEKVWSEALQLVEKNKRDYQHRLLRDLVSEERSGHDHIRYALDMRPGRDGDLTFIRIVRPFIKVIAHSAFLDCLSLDTYIGDLYVFMSGSGGTRAIPFFHSLGQSIIKESSKLTETNNLRFDDLVSVMSNALREVLRRSQRSIFHEDLPVVLDDLVKISQMRDSVARDIIVTRVAELQRMLARAKGLLVDPPGESHRPNLQPTFQVASTYPRDIRIPGDRHDNDKRDINSIRIIPTKGEIVCDQSDFLPSLNLNQPHFLDGVERLFDTHFRLLRHDIFGDVRLVLGNLLSTDDEAQVQVAKKSANDIGVHFYKGASIRRLNFTRRRGFEASVSFPQPHHLRSKSAADRRRWWEDTRRLEEGALLCFVSLSDDTKPLVFLSVSERIADPKHQQSLTSDARYAGISAKLADGQDPGQVEFLMKLNTRTSPNDYLIEFPRVLLATFLPVLENLQRMHKYSRLPFDNWILPNWEGDAREVDTRVPPPLYARVPGFAFDLKPIITDSADSLMFKPTSDHQEMLGKLQGSTLLDGGQCKALINALTSEFTLIQGPPGTGKSYLGVQLMRVLVENKVKATLGPILVV